VKKCNLLSTPAVSITPRFGLLSLFRPPFPLAGAALGFSNGIVVSYGLRRKRWRYAEERDRLSESLADATVVGDTVLIDWVNPRLNRYGEEAVRGLACQVGQASYIHGLIHPNCARRDCATSMAGL